jgi:hypothetical protein
VQGEGLLLWIARRARQRLRTRERPEALFRIAEKGLAQAQGALDARLELRIARRLGARLGP